MARVLLLRHGETLLNSESRYSGQRDSPLTPRGQAQQGRLRARLAADRIGRVVSSDIARCAALAAAIAADHGLTAEADPAFREAGFGDWEGLTYAEAMGRDRAAMVAFNRDTVRVAPPGGETLLALEARARPAFDALVKAHKDREGSLLLVSHGGTLRALLCSLLQIPLDRHWTLNVDSASLSILDVYPMGPIVSVLNDTCHLNGME